MLDTSSNRELAGIRIAFNKLCIFDLEVLDYCGLFRNGFYAEPLAGELGLILREEKSGD